MSVAPGRSIGLALFFLGTCSVPMWAQRLGPDARAALPSSFTAQLPVRHSALWHGVAPDSTRPGGQQRTYWKEGAIVGGLGTGIATAYLADGLCESDCSAGTAILSGVLGTLPGIVVGGLIGSLFPKN